MKGSRARPPASAIPSAPQAPAVIEHTVPTHRRSVPCSPAIRLERGHTGLSRNITMDARFDQPQDSSRVRRLHTSAAKANFRDAVIALAVLMLTPLAAEA